MIGECFLRASLAPVLLLTGALALAACSTTAPAGADADADASADVASTAGVESDAAPAAANDILDTLGMDPAMSTLSRILEETGLADQLRGAGPYTLFAPNDAAFADLPPGTVDALLLPDNQARLIQILSYHVVSGKLSSGDVAGRSSPLDTLEGRSLDVDGDNGVHVGSATVITPDIDATNGVIHVIDKVLIP